MTRHLRLFSKPAPVRGRPRLLSPALAVALLLGTSGFTATPTAIASPDAERRILTSSTREFVIIDDGDERAATLVDGLETDVYVAHPTVVPRPVVIVTDQGRLAVTLGPRQTFDYVIRYQGVDYPQRIADEDPSPPVYTGAASRPGGIDEIPFRLGPNNAIHLTASLNGSAPLDLIFDTGASVSVAAEGAIRRGVRPASGEGNILSVGPVRVSGLPLISIDYRGSLRADGVIGYDAFRSRIVEVDYDRLVLRIHHDRPDVSGYSRLTFRWDDTVSLVPIRLDVGDRSHVVMSNFDTGSKWSVSLRGSDPAAAAFADRPSLGSRTARRADGSQVRSDVKSAPRVVFAGAVLTDVQVDVERDATGQGLEHTILGNDFLKRFNLIIDYRTSEVFLRPNGLIDTPYNRPGLFAGLASAPITLGATAVGLTGLMILGATLALRRRSTRTNV